MPPKSLIENDCYALGWPFTEGSELNLIKNKLDNFLDFNKFQKNYVSHELYIKYRNTQIFYDYIQNEEVLLYESICKLQIIINYIIQFTIF